MSRAQYALKTQDEKNSDMHNGYAYSVSTREKLTPYINIPAQSAIYIQGKTVNKMIEMFRRGYEIVNDSGVAGIDVEISLYQNCTSDTDDSNVDTFNLSNDVGVGSLLIHTNPQNVVLGDYRGDLSKAVKTEAKAVYEGVDSESEYIMPLNDKSVIVIENFTTNVLGIAFYWQYIEKG